MGKYTSSRDLGKAVIQVKEHRCGNCHRENLTKSYDVLKSKKKAKMPPKAGADPALLVTMLLPQVSCRALWEQQLEILGAPEREPLDINLPKIQLVLC